MIADDLASEKLSIDLSLYSLEQNSKGRVSGFFICETGNVIFLGVWTGPTESQWLYLLNRRVYGMEAHLLAIFLPP